MLNKLKSKYEQYLAANKFKGNPPMLYESMNYIMNIGGKRVRPILTLLGAKVSGGKLEAALPVAHALEVFHNFTLAHDDIMDDAPTRRGKPSLHVKENTATAILAGDNMMITAFDIILNADLPNKTAILETLTNTAREVCEGQQMDMDFEKINHVTIEQYIEMIRLKTAVLLGCCLQCGSISANAPQSTYKLLYSFGVNIGIAFQIMDDYLDLYGNSELTGKRTGGDILAAKKTALFNLAWSNANQLQREKLELWFDKTKTDEDTRLANTSRLFDELNIQQRCKTLMEERFSSAKELLVNSTLNKSDYQDLLDLVEFLRSREE